MRRSGKYERWRKAGNKEEEHSARCVTVDPAPMLTFIHLINATCNLA